MRTLLVLIAVTICNVILAQTPNGFKYQAIVRDANSAIITDQAVGLQISIIKETITGPVVYTETFSEITNAFGLINIVVGSGTTQDNFESIDWGSGTFFIETAIDIAGGTNYEVMGTSQLLSVPYALHAKTAETVLNDNDVDETNELQSLKVSLTGDTLRITKSNYVIIPGISVANYSVQGLLDDGYTPCELFHGGTPLDSLYGKHYAGGYLFYLDIDNCNGLVASYNNLGTNITWGCYGRTIIGADGVSVGDGKSNTEDILLGCLEEGIAARLCNDYSSQGFSDWFLPSKNELVLIYENLKLLGIPGFENSYYWSSTEGNATSVWGMNFSNGSLWGGYAKNLTYVNTIPVREF